jgi:hypothetical protein
MLNIFNFNLKVVTLVDTNAWIYIWKFFGHWKSTLQ